MSSSSKLTDSTEGVIGTSNLQLADKQYRQESETAISILKWGGGGIWCETEPLTCGIYFQVDSAKMDLQKDIFLVGGKNPHL